VLERIDFEFTPLNDEHFECSAGAIPETLVEINLNGCREISERTIMLVAE